MYSERVGGPMTEPDTMYLNLVETISQAARDSGMIRRPGKISTLSNYKNFDVKRLEYKNLIRKEKRKIKRERGLYNFSKLRNLKKEFWKYLEIKKKNERLEKIEKLAISKDTKEFWKILNSFRKKNYNSNPINISSWQTFPPREQFITPPITDTKKQILDLEITIEELLTVLNKTENGKSPGIDKTTYEFYKGLPQNWLLYILVTFNKIIEKGEVPKA